MSTPLTTSEPTPPPRRRRRLWLVLVVTVLAGVIVDGSRCTPADPTKPIVIQGDLPAATPDPAVLRVATFNIHSGRGTDRHYDLSRTATVFPVAPDLVGLNEVRGTLESSLWPDQARQLGTLLGMQSAFVPTERRWWHDHFGNGLLTRLPLQQIQRLQLAGKRGKAYRCAVWTQFEFQHQTVQLLSVHVDSQSDRESQLQSVVDLYRGLKPPSLLIGDLNSTREDPRMQELLALPDVVNPLQDAPPDARGRLHIDWILARGFHCRSGQLIENSASDHPAIMAELELLPLNAP